MNQTEIIECRRLLKAQLLLAGDVQRDSSVLLAFVELAETDVPAGDIQQQLERRGPVKPRILEQLGDRLLKFLEQVPIKLSGTRGTLRDVNQIGDGRDASVVTRGEHERENNHRHSPRLDREHENLPFSVDQRSYRSHDRTA